MNKTYSTLIALIVLFGGNLVLAQGFYNNGAIVNIGSNVIFSVQDSLVNTGTLTNNGNMIIGGVWLNRGIYNPGIGEITFNSPSGSNPQIINHNNQSFSKLTISGGGEKVILANMTIVGELILTNGIITNQNNASVIFRPSAIITNGSNQSHINAPVHQQGTGDKVFPLGNGSEYLPVVIRGIPVQSGVGVTPVELSSPENFNTTSALSDISEKRYWEINLDSGSLETTTIVLPVVNDEGLDGPEARYVVAYSESSPIEFRSLGKTGAVSNGRVESAASPATGRVTLAVASENQSIVVFNAISPNSDDGLNDYIHIDNLLESDVISIYNRWGDLVFEMTQYNNNEVAKRFNGQSNVGGSKDLPAGNYFYVIRRKAGKEVSGYLSLRK